METSTDLAAALAALRAIGTRFPTASDDELLADVAGWEALGRLVDARRLAAAAEVESRSPVRSGLASLAFRNGATDGKGLLADTTRIHPMVAKRRIGLGAALAPKTTLLGDTLPSRYPVLTEAMQQGLVGVDSARIIVEAAQHIRARVDDDRIQTMVESLTADAQALPFEIVRDNASWWVAYLDPDGRRPEESLRRRKRRFRMRRVGLDGTASFSGIATAEDIALLKELFASRRRGAELDRTEPGGDAAGASGSLEAEWIVKPSLDGDDRTREQQDYDTLMEALRAAMAAERAGSQPVSPLHDIVIQVSARDLAAGAGQGWTAGVMAGLPLPTVERLSCGATTRYLITGDEGEPLWLGRSQRVFSAAQKKALTVAAGGRCQVPGCTTPAPYLEAHHVAWWDRDSGPTDIEFGIMLCSYHHHLVHVPGSPIEIIRWRDANWVVPRGWRGPPDERHRPQRGIPIDPDANHPRRSAA